MRRFVSGAAALAFIALTPSLSQAQVTLGPAIAYHDDFDLGLGAALSMPMPSIGDGIGLVVDFLYFFPSLPAGTPAGVDVDYLELNGNLTYDFPLQESTVVPYVLGGLNIANGSFGISVGGLSASGSSTEIGLNLGGGIKFNLGTFRPSVGAKFEVSGGEGFVIFGSLPFVIGN